MFPLNWFKWTSKASVGTAEKTSINFRWLSIIWRRSLSHWKEIFSLKKKHTHTQISAAENERSNRNTLCVSQWAREHQKKKKNLVNTLVIYYHIAIKMKRNFVIFNKNEMFFFFHQILFTKESRFVFTFSFTSFVDAWVRSTMFVKRSVEFDLDLLMCTYENDRRVCVTLNCQRIFRHIQMVKMIVRISVETQWTMMRQQLTRSKWNERFA